MAIARETDLRAFVERHQRGLQRWLRALGCAADAAEEHCQDALLAALQHGIDARPVPVAASWLRTTARNLFWARLRQQRREPPVVAIEPLEVAWQAVRGDDDGGAAALAALRECLAAAEPRDRELVQARYADGAPRRAMAARFGVGEPAIKQALRRARARLLACVEHKLGGGR
ncbi:MAG: sigma-70 family RNA polymerase sigma factor [Planctomycetes bacterium]|nr:sigma-70 family RNA polymerase sigma factor [Planctomycetota bacterium]